MSSATPVGARPVIYTAADFSFEAAKKIQACDENGNSQEMTVHAFVHRGSGIMEGLLGRVNQLRVDWKQINADHASLYPKAKELLGQYTMLEQVASDINGIAVGMKDMLGTYDKNSDQGVLDAQIVMNENGAKNLIARYEAFVTVFKSEYYTAAAVSPNLITRKRYLANEIGKLQAEVVAYESDQGNRQQTAVDTK